MMSDDPRADTYAAHVRAARTVYGVVGELSDAEETTVRSLYREGAPLRVAIREVLGMRGRWPKEPDPRRTYPTRRGVPGQPATDDFGRSRRSGY